MQKVEGSNPFSRFSQFSCKSRDSTVSPLPLLC
jgi:hypothetical protein